MSTKNYLVLDNDGELYCSECCDDICSGIHCVECAQEEHVCECCPECDHMDCICAPTEPEEEEEEVLKMNYLGICNKVRTFMRDGEAFWQEMMSKKERISMEELEESCDVSPLLDEGETFAEWVGIDGECFISSVCHQQVYFVQVHGFEFIFNSMGVL